MHTREMAPAERTAGAAPGLLAALLAAHLTAGARPQHVVGIVPARTRAPLRRVSPHYVSFALDNAFVRDPAGTATGTPLPPDATNSVRVDFQDALLNTVMPLVAGGFIRIGGTYTDFVHYYVPGTNYTRCPYVLTLPAVLTCWRAHGQRPFLHVCRVDVCSHVTMRCTRPGHAGTPTSRASTATAGRAACRSPCSGGKRRSCGRTATASASSST